MKLLICDENKINSYQLPEKVEDFYMINYNDSNQLVQETINLEAENGHWVLTSDSTLTIKDNGNIINKAILDVYTSYQISFVDLEKSIYLQIIPDFETYTKVIIQNISNISIGSSNSCNIIYNNSKTLLKHATIIQDNNNLLVKTEMDKDCNIYVNMKKVEETKLKFGDVIFINGLKIIIMDGIVLINNPNQKVQLKDLSIIKSDHDDNINNYTPVTEIERNIKLYKDNQLFFHTPRLKNEIKTETVSIESPPDAEQEEQMPAFLTIGSSAIFGIISCTSGISAIYGLSTGSMDLFNVILELIMCILMLISCIFFPIIIEIWQKKQRKKREKRRQERYKAYLAKKTDEIEKIIKHQELILKENNFSLESIQQKIVEHDNSIWSREIIDNDFLNLKIGIGNISPSLIIEAQTEQFSLYDDNLKDEVNNIKTKKRIIENVPVTISLVKNKISPFIINSKYKQNYIDSLMIQLIFYYSGLDLKIVLFTNEENEEKWKYLKYLPHIWNNDKDIRFFSTNENEMLQISLFLEQEYDRRLKGKDSEKNEEKRSEDNENLYKNYSEYYLIITDDFKSVKNSSIINRILNSTTNIGFSLMIIENSLKNLPSRLEKFINIENDMGVMLSRDLDPKNEIQFNPSYSENVDIEKYSKIIANIPLSIKSITKAIPSQLSFLEMYHAGRIEHLNVLSRWSENNPTISLKTPIGMKENNKYIELDLHEKFHGPHGLIAGTTGSGKSEIIITYILSMAINYHPYEVQFILIDYKGGGLAGAFENRETGIRIPHLVGTITNLDTSEMNRTLVSIKSELKRRQIKFNEARDKLGEGTIDIYKYQKFYREGKLTEPISHLFVIADEFAELKEQQPDFMDELVSTARIGRSLGIHLILATQKPSGVVNDQIWSNTKFRICLKVQDESDSREMLKRSEAANLKQVGSFYLQVGNDEIFELGQSAWAGAKYNPVDRIIKKIDDNIDFVENDGNIIKTINDEVKVNETLELGEQLTNIVKYLYNLAINENIKFSNLWLPSIPNNIYLNNLVKKYNYQPKKFIIDGIIGEYDKPYNQHQGLYKISLSGQNTLIYGLPGSGKENLLQTIIYSACIYHTPQEVQFYLLDFGAETLTTFNKMPHVGDVILASEKEKISAEFDYLEKLIKQRKELFMEYSGDYLNYCQNSNSSVPLIVTVLNSYESFMENIDEYTNDYLSHLLREGSKLGIVFIISAVSTNSIRTSMTECFSNKMILQTADDFDYRYILGAESGLIPKKVFGRGIATIDEEACEFQTAYITEKNNINTLVKQTSKYLTEHYKFKAHPIKKIPTQVTLKDMLKENPTIQGIPLGFSRDEVELVRYDFTKNQINLVIGETILNNVTFTCGIIDLCDSLNNIKLNLIDLLDCISTDGKMSYYNSNFTEVFTEILSNQYTTTTVNIILGIGNIENVLTEEELKQFDLIMNNYNKINNNYFIIIDNYSRFQNIIKYEWYNKFDKRSGIWLGENIEEQKIFTINNLTNYDADEKMASVAYIINNNDYTVIKGIGDE